MSDRKTEESGTNPRSATALTVVGGLLGLFSTLTTILAWRGDLTALHIVEACAWAARQFEMRAPQLFLLLICCLVVKWRREICELPVLAAESYANSVRKLRDLRERSASPSISKHKNIDGL